VNPLRNDGKGFLRQVLVVLKEGAIHAVQKSDLQFAFQRSAAD
jgi:hypothetical protein